MLEKIHPYLAWEDEWTVGLDKISSSSFLVEHDLPDLIYGCPSRRILGYAYWWMHLSMETIWILCKRLRIPAQTEKVIMQAAELVRATEYLAGKPPSYVTDYLDGFSDLAMTAVWAGSKDSNLAQLLQQYQKKWKHIHPYVDGHTLHELGIPSGPQYREILSSLRHAWLDGEINSREQEKALLAKYLPG